MGLLATVLGTTPLDTQPLPTAVPVLEVIKIYGKLAGPECYGQKSPKGSSCQVTLRDIENLFESNDNYRVLTEDEFRDTLNRVGFQWPLKPYGVDKSLSKTATMNKGAETKVFMDQLEERGLYDKRNPTGPLPTSLRPQLNRLLQEEGVDSTTCKQVFQALGGRNGQLKVGKMEEFFRSDMDYYGFLELIGKESITWPY